MAKKTTFTVSKKGHDPVEVSWDAPESLSDERWNEVVSEPDSDINNLAVQALIVKTQAGARNHLENGQEAVQRYVDGYKFGARSGGFVAPSISAADAKKAKFSPEQMELLRKAGMKIEAAA
jgi:hypothetical protein